MEQYLNLGGNSNVKAYSIGQDYIDVVLEEELVIVILTEVQE